MRKGRGRYVLQRQACTSLIWRTVLRTDSRDAANARFLSHSVNTKPGGSLRLVDDHDGQVLAKHPQPVQTDPACSTC